MLRQAAQRPQHYNVRAQVRHLGQAPTGSNIVVLPGDLDTIHPDLFPQTPHVLVHLAVKNIDEDGSGYIKTNVNGNSKLLSHCNEYTKGIIYSSSLSVLGQGEQNNVSNLEPVKPETALAVSRALAEKQILRSAEHLSISAYCLRPRFILGENDRFVLPALKNLAKKGLLIGSGQQQYSIIDVQDYAHIILELAQRCMTSTSVEQLPLNIGYQSPISYSCMYNLLRKQNIPSNRSRRLPSPMLMATVLKLVPLNKCRTIATQLQLIGASHFSDITETQKRLQSSILLKDSKDYFEQLAYQFKDATCR